MEWPEPHRIRGEGLPATKRRPEYLTLGITNQAEKYDARAI
jgi:hypothetical protein